jgi:hypothetical protein
MLHMPTPRLDRAGLLGSGLAVPVLGHAADTAAAGAIAWAPYLGALAAALLLATAWWLGRRHGGADAANALRQERQSRRDAEQLAGGTR